jgi:hypothetical protein
MQKLFLPCIVLKKSAHRIENMKICLKLLNQYYNNILMAKVHVTHRYFSE